MTNEIKFKVLNALSKQQLTRKQLHKYCSDNDINTLRFNQLIYHSKPPKNIKGVLIPTDTDTFALTDYGKNVLSQFQDAKNKQRKELLLKIAALLVAATSAYAAFVHP